MESDSDKQFNFQLGSATQLKDGAQFQTESCSTSSESPNQKTSSFRLYPSLPTSPQEVDSHRRASCGLQLSSTSFDSTCAQNTPHSSTQESCASAVVQPQCSTESFLSSYGLGSLSCQSQYVTLTSFAVVLCLAVSFESFCSNGINPTNYQSLETRYSFSSTTSGIISVMFDVAYCALAVPISYFGTRYLSKPKWLAFGLTLVSVACLTMASPHFISDTYQVATDIELTSCDPNRTILFCEATADNTNDDSLLYPVLLCLGNFLLGAGTVAQNTLAVHYFEENSGNGGFYFGLMQACRSLGSITGAGLNAFFLTVPVDLDELPIDSSHVLWVGAWWIGLVVGATGVLLFIPFLALFPKSFDNTYTRNKDLRNSDSEEVSFRSQLSEIFTNVPWIFVNLASIPEAVIYSGLVTFGAKYFQQSLAMSSSGAAITFALVIILGTCGSVTGAIVSRKLKTFKSIVKTLMAVTLLEMILSSTILVHCPEQRLQNVPLSHLDQSLADKSSSSSFGYSDSRCYEECQCSSSLFQPVCHQHTELTYFSACHGGCDENLEQCSCVKVEEDYSEPHNSSLLPSVQDGFCSVSCIEKYLAILGLGFFCFTMLIKIPIGLAASLKLLSSPEDASLALAVSNIALRILGMCSGPLIFGVIMDHNCEVWDATCDKKGGSPDKDGLETGSCLQYKLSTLSISLFLVVLICSSIPQMFYALTIFAYNKTHFSVNLSKYRSTYHDNQRPPAQTGLELPFDLYNELYIDPRDKKSAMAVTDKLDLYPSASVVCVERKFNEEDEKTTDRLYLNAAKLSTMN